MPGRVRIAVEHGFLGFQWGGACVEEVILLAGLVSLARNQACAAIWIKSITPVAHDPSATDKHVIIDPVHVVFCVKFPNSVIQVLELLYNR